MFGSEEVLPPDGGGGQLLPGGDGGDGGAGGGEDCPEETGAKPGCCQHCDCLDGRDWRLEKD